MFEEIDLSWFLPSAHEHRGERALWSAVLLQQILDAKNIPKNNEDAALRIHADAWLRLSNPDFRMVCELADLDPYVIILWVEQARDRAFVWRAGGTNQRRRWTDWEKRTAARMYIIEGKKPRVIAPVIDRTPQQLYVWLNNHRHELHRLAGLMPPTTDSHTEGTEES